ncbi:MAG TPA: hypothetical protein VGV85_04935 [Longimicrobiaceae bacterium]|nr:hypothetical protein [Longimicrobiaceae bacterium]
MTGSATFPAGEAAALHPARRAGGRFAKREVSLHVATAAVVALSLLLGSPTLTLVLGGTLCSFVYPYLAFREARRAPLWLSPLSFYFIWYAVSLGPAAFYMGTFVAEGEWVPLSVTLVSPRDVAVAYVIFLWGSVALHTGLQMTRPPSRPGDGDAPAARGRRRGLLAWLVVLWFAGLLTTWSPDLITAFGAPGRILQWSGFASLSAVALVSRRQLGLSRLAYVGIFTVGTLGLFGVNLMSYSKAYLMFSLVPVIWAFLVRPKLRRWLPALGGSFVALYLFVLSPVITLARYSELAPGESAAERVVDTFEVFVRSGGVAVEGLSVGDYAEALMYRQYDPLPLGFFLEQVRNSGFEDGSTMSYAAYALVPRVLWPGKPTITKGAWFAYYIGFAESEESATMALGISATGELYWNFGVPGVLIGLLLIGLLLGTLWRIAGADPRHDPIRMLLYVMVMFNMGNMAEAVTVFTFIVAAFFVFEGALSARGLLRYSTRRAHGSFAARRSHPEVLPHHG